MAADQGLRLEFLSVVPDGHGTYRWGWDSSQVLVWVETDRTVLRGGCLDCSESFDNYDKAQRHFLTEHEDFKRRQAFLSMNWNRFRSKGDTTRALPVSFIDFYRLDPVTGCRVVLHVENRPVGPAECAE